MGSPAPEILHAFQELAFEFIGDQLRHNEAFRGNARLSVVEYPDFHCPCIRRLQIRAGNNVNAPSLGIDTSIDTVVQLSDQLFGPSLEVRECIPR
jgi:hypothetical protein